MAKQSLYFRFGLQMREKKFWFLGEDLYRDVALNNCLKDKERLDLTSFLIIDLWENNSVNKLDKWLTKHKLSAGERAIIMRDFADFINGIIDESERSSER